MEPGITLRLGPPNETVEAFKITDSSAVEMFRMFSEDGALERATALEIIDFTTLTEICFPTGQVARLVDGRWEVSDG